MAQSDEDLEILSAVECPVCYQYMLPPIYQCATGHSICNECKKKLPECPSCKSWISSLRNYTLEGLVVRLKFPCPFSKDGCKAIVHYSDLDAHKENCDYCTYNCMYCNCDGFLLGDYREHHLTYHREKFVDVGCKVSFTMNTHRLLMIYQKRLFYLITGTMSNLLILALQYVGLKCNAENYAFKITISSDEFFKTLEASQNCALFPGTLKETNDSGRCIAIDINYIKSFKNPYLSVDIMSTAKL